MLHNGPQLPRAAGQRLPGVHFQQIMVQFTIQPPLPMFTSAPPNRRASIRSWFWLSRWDWPSTRGIWSTTQTLQGGRWCLRALLCPLSRFRALLPTSYSMTQSRTGQEQVSRSPCRASTAHRLLHNFWCLSHHQLKQVNWKWSKTRPLSVLREQKQLTRRCVLQREPWLTTGTPQVQQPSFVLCDQKASMRYLMAVSVLHMVCSQVKINSQRGEQKKAPRELWLLSLQNS